jgi:hypothetical protein
MQNEMFVYTVALYFLMWKVLGSNPGRVTGSPDKGFLWFSQSLQANTGT